MWQDTVLMIGNLALAIALIPAVLVRAKMPRATTILTASVLTSFAFIFATLGLWQSVGAVSISASLWWVLLIQRGLRG